MFKFIEMIAKRESLGKLFAEGVKKTSDEIGKGSEKIRYACKGS